METVHNRKYGIYPLGLAVRGSINNEYTYRVRPGNGFYNAIAGKVYQDKYAYFVPSSINNPEGQGARDAYAAGVINWQGFSGAQKKVYNDIVTKRGLHMSGYNYYLGIYIRANA